MPHSYENYDDKSKTYTAMRRPIGVEKMVAHFEASGVPIDQQRLLDSGCGTGNYMVAMIATHGFRLVHCSDYNQAMVNEAKANYEAKCKGLGDVLFTTDNICDMVDVPSDSYDACCNNQVIHHLRGDDDFADLRRACKEWNRILRSNGRLSINWSPPKNQMAGMWWSELIPEAQNTWNPRSPSQEKMEDCLRAAGFEDVRFEALNDEILYDPELYMKPENFLDIENFRRSDSTFNLCTEEEIKSAVAKVEKMIADGTLGDWFKKKEEERKEVGQTMTVYCVKK